MNNADLIQLEQERINILKQYHLDEEGIKTYRQHLKEQKKQVSQEESDQLGKELYDFISRPTYNELTTEYDKVIEYIYNGANLEYRTPKKGDFALLLCARRNHLQTFALLVKFGADINKGNDYQTTPVMTSARHGHKKILELLILLGADINAQCLDGDNALMSAKRHNQRECFEMLKNANAHFGTRNLLNQTVRDIPSSQEFDFSSFFTFENFIDNECSYDKTQVILQEAQQKLAEIVKESASETEIDKEEAKQKTREFKRIK